jgi:hypothetical protein
VLERIPSDDDASGPLAWVHTKALYRLSEESRQVLKGCTTEMCSTSSMPAALLAALEEGRPQPE